MNDSFNLFAYGTLRHSENAAGETGILRGCELTGSASVHGTLYDIDGEYPALMLYGETRIRGAVWRCPVEALKSLDEYENIAGGLFRRVATHVLIDVAADRFEHVPCWLYVAGPALAHKLTPANRVDHGDWESARSTPA